MKARVESQCPKFSAVGGYDLCTGLGTPAGATNLINALANPETLLIMPSMGFNSTGGIGGPFTITSQNFSLTNAGTNSLTWTLANTSAWLTTASSSRRHAGAQRTRPATVTVSLNFAASNLVVGTYSTTLWITNVNDNIGQSRQFALSVISPPTITMQPTDQAVLEGATAAFTVAATGGLPLSYQWQDNGNNLSDGGNISGSATTNLVISSVVPGQRRDLYGRRDQPGRHGHQLQCGVEYCSLGTGHCAAADQSRGGGGF